MAQSTGSSVSSSRSQDKQASSFRYGGGDLNESERAGAEIWFNATAGNSRFHTYVFQQRLGVSIDWYRVLNADAREQRFNRWGLINDPDCCKPGDPNCPAKSMDDTYGFDYCPGDDTLLQFVGKTGYKDPACDFTDASLAPDDPHGPKDLRQSACDLEFGTSTGALGLRKFPNPNFSKSQWLKVNKGRLGTWAGYTEKVQHSDDSVAPFSRLTDGSIEPPFRIGMSWAPVTSRSIPSVRRRILPSLGGKPLWNSGEPILSLLANPGLGDGARHDRVSSVCSRQTRHGRHLRCSHRSGQQPRHD